MTSLPVEKGAISLEVMLKLKFWTHYQYSTSGFTLLYGYWQHGVRCRCLYV